MRYRQVKNPETGRYHLVPADDAARAAEGQIIVKGKFDAFKSPIDGSEIRTHRQYEDHCKKHNVVPSAEFSPEYYKRKEQERRKVYERADSRTNSEKWRDRAQINEIINRVEKR